MLIAGLCPLRTYCNQHHKAIQSGCTAFHLQVFLALFSVIKNVCYFQKKCVFEYFICVQSSKMSSSTCMKSLRDIRQRILS